MFHHVRSLGSRLGVAVLATAALTAPASAQLLAPNVSFGGATQNQWAARWYQWNLPIPIGPGPEANRAANSPNPAVETNGSQAFKGNNVFPGVSFLTGVFGGLAGTETAVRTAFVPSGNFLFFPLINNSVDNTVAPGGTPTNFTPNQLVTNYDIGLPVNLSLVNSFNNASNLSLVVDGVSQSIQAGHHQTNGGVGFNVTYTSADNLLEAGGYDSTLGTGVFPSSVLTAGDGYWAALAPLTPGNHTLRFTATASYYGADGQVLDFDPGTAGVQAVTFNQDITYKLVVGAPEPGSALLLLPIIAAVAVRRRRATLR